MHYATPFSIFEKIDEWVSKGAQISDRVKRLIKDSKLSPEELDARKAAKKDKVTNHSQNYS